MAKVEVDLMDVHENSLDNSADSEYCGMVDDGSFESSECEGSQNIVSNAYLDGSEDTTSSYSFKDLSGAVTYKLVQMKDEEPSDMTTHSPSHVMPSGEFYVISNPEDIFSSSNPQKKVIRRQPLQPKAVTAKKRDDKRRATHNEVERRRRDKINSWITKLAALVPNSGLPDTASKGGILAKACEYITELTDKQKKLEKLEVDNDKLVLEILRLNHELTELRKENSAMHIQLAEKCISLPNTRPKGEKS